MSTSSLSQISLDSLPASWHTEPHSIGSLGSLIKHYGQIYLHIGGMLRGLVLDSSMSSQFDALPSAHESMISILMNLRKESEPLGLQATLHRINRLIDDVDNGITALQWQRSLDVLAETLEDELEDRSFMYIRPDDAEMFKNPAKGFALTVRAYPSVRGDIDEACRCYALGRYTASVYHSMAIVQAGLHGLATDLGVEFKFSLDLAEWQSIIQAIESKIEPMRSLPRSEKAEKLTFYSECALQFRYFKDAWRNHVAHMREVYDRDQSHSILIHVRDFMEKLSTRITEPYQLDLTTLDNQ